LGGSVFRQRDLEEYVADRVRTVCADLASAAPARQLHGKDWTPDVESRLGEKMQTHLMGTGLLFEKINAVEFFSRDYEKDLSQANRADNEVRRRERRLKELADFLQKEGSVKALLEQIQDPKLRSLVYARLFLSDRLDATSIAATLDERGLEEVYRTMQGILSGEGAPMDEIVSDSAARLYAVAGPKIIDVDAREPHEMRVHDVGEGIRSVRSAQVSGRDVLLLGVKRGCVVFDPEDQTKKSFPLPDLKKPQGGVNAMAVRGTSLFATHSEFGLALWDLSQPGKAAELLYDAETAKHKTIRAVQCAQERLLFAGGSDVYAVDLADLSAPLVRYGGAQGLVTGVAGSAGSIYASTEDGAILQWDVTQPDYPSVLLRKNEPIFNLRLARVRGVAHLLYTFGDTSVHARVLGQTIEIEFEALGATFTLFDAASDLVVACGHRGRTLFLWRPSNPRRPSKTIDLSKIEAKEVMDLCLRKAMRVEAVA
jgi:hypothetical protein